MSNRRSKQQVKIARQRLSNVIILFFLLLMFLFFLSFSIRNIIICNHINNNKLKEYSGMYTISESHRLRNTIYYVYLENGDVLRITPELLKDDRDFAQFSTLHFTYSAPKFGLVSAYTCVEISDINRNEHYIECKDSLDEATTGTYVGIIMSFIFLCLIVLPSCALFSQAIHHQKKQK